MQNLFDEKDAGEFFAKYPGVPEELSLRVYTSRLIGRDPNLVLHGGGNTSVKLRMKNLFDEEQEILYVKGSGFDLAEIEPSGFVGLDLGPLRRLREIESLSDEEMENPWSGGPWGLRSPCFPMPCLVFPWRERCLMLTRKMER